MAKKTVAWRSLLSVLATAIVGLAIIAACGGTDETTGDESCSALDVQCGSDGDCCAGGFCDNDGYCSPVAAGDDDSTGAPGQKCLIDKDCLEPANPICNLITGVCGPDTGAPVDDDSTVGDDDTSAADDDTTLPVDDDSTIPGDDATAVDDDTTLPADDDSCMPNCTGKVCGDDGCGGFCGSCNAPQVCDANGQCGDAGCVGDYQCAAPTPKCDMVSGKCVECVVDNDCTNPMCCDSTNNTCTVTCQTTGCNPACGTQEYCDTSTTPPHCVGGPTQDCNTTACTLALECTADPSYSECDATLGVCCKPGGGPVAGECASCTDDTGCTAPLKCLGGFGTFLPGACTLVCATDTDCAALSTAKTCKPPMLPIGDSTCDCGGGGLPIP
jgi:hypothetical protein